VVADLKARLTPDARYGQIAKLRSTHNNYLTLPVIFLMLSGHYPLAFATDYSWIIASLVFLMGVTIRHYFNTRHARAGNPRWTWVATGLIFLIIMMLSIWPALRSGPDHADQATVDLPGQMPPHAKAFVEDQQFAEVTDIIAGRCSMCHARAPLWDGMISAPKGVFLETSYDIASTARDIYLQSAVSHAMPPANLSYMEPAERALVRQWYERANRR